MTTTSALLVAFEQRLPLVEALRRKTRSLALLQLAGYITIFVFFLALLVGGFVGTIWYLGNFVTQNLVVVFGTALAVAAGVILLAIFSFKRFARWRGDAQDEYVAAFRNQVVLPTLRDFLPGLSVSSEGTMSVDTFKASQLFEPSHDRFKAAYGFEGSLGGVRFMGSTIRAWKYIHEVRHERMEDVTYFNGLFFHLERPVSWPGTVRLVDRQHYATGEAGGIRVVRRSGTAHVHNVAEAFDPGAMLVIDEAVGTPPAIPEQAFRTWLELRKLLGKPLFLSFNATGVYLALAIPESQRWPLEERLHAPNQAKELAEDTERLQRALRAVELLRRLFP
jgi:hypothetical protein